MQFLDLRTIIFGPNMSPTQSQAPTEWIDRDMLTHGHDASGLGVTLEGTQMVMKYCPDRKRV